MQRKLLGLLIVVASNVFAQTSAPLSEDDPVVWKAREARAKSLREESSSLRRTADDQLLRDDAVCRKKFLENACKDSARERWIEEINKVRVMEIEAVGLERNQRAHEAAMREKERVDNPPRLPLILPSDGTSAPEVASAPQVENTRSRADKSAAPPKPQAKPTNASKDADQAVKKQQEREKSAQQASARAEQARKDAARYAAHASEHAQKEAERRAKQAGSSAAAQSSASTSK